MIKSDGEITDSFHIIGNKIKIEGVTGAEENPFSSYSSPFFWASLMKKGVYSSSDSLTTLLSSNEAWDDGEQIINIEPGSYYFEITSTDLAGYVIEVYDSISLI